MTAAHADSPMSEDRKLAQPSRASYVSLRTSLVSLVVVCVLPVASAALLLVVQQYKQGREQVRTETLLEARRGIAAVDREFAAAIAGMKVLATAPELATDDLAAWHRRASAAATAQNVDNFLLTDRDGRQRVNTLRAFGTALPASGTPPQLERIFSGGYPVVTDLFIGPVTQRPVMAIGVPVSMAGSVRYSLNMGMAPHRFQVLLDATPLPAGWVAAVLDGQGTIVARTRDPERFAGQRAVPEVLRQIAGGGEGSIETLTLDGVRVVSSLGRSTLSSWSVVVGAPQAQLERQLVWSVGWTAAGVIAATLCGLWLALSIGRRVSGAVEGLNTAARALADGGPITLPALRLREADAVGEALLHASDILQQTRHAAQHDPLTGLSNRALFGELLNRQLAGAMRHNGRFAVLMLDLDGLKRINDEGGHAVGDDALRATARRILHTMRAADAAARLGGDEFAVLLDDVDEPQARAAAIRLLAALTTPDDGYPEPLSASIGVAVWPGSGAEAGEILNVADTALYAAKRSGKGRINVAAIAAPGPGSGDAAGRARVASDASARGE